MAAGKNRRSVISTRSINREGGQATVEFALVLPIVVLFALMVVQIGLVAKDVVLVHHAAREAARAAAVDPTVAAARAGATGSSRLDPDRMTVELGGTLSEGGRATATVTYRSPTTLPLVGLLAPDVSITASVSMRVE